AVTKFLKDGVVSVDIFGISRASESTTLGGAALPSGLATTFAAGEEGGANASPVQVELVPITAPLNRVEAEVVAGDTYRVEVVVRTRKVGHFFPGGTADAFALWPQLEGT